MVKQTSLLYIIAFCVLLTCHQSSRPPIEYGLPAVHLFIDTDDLKTISSNVFGNTYVDAKLICGEHEYYAQIRHHGNFSREFLKKSYRIRFSNNDLFENKEQLVLSSQWLDKSLMKTSLAFHLYEQAGLMTAEYTIISLFINDEYRGLYYMIEPVDDCYFMNRNTNSGHRFRALTGTADFTFEGGYDVRTGFRREPDGDGSYSDLEYLIAILDSTLPESLPGEIESVLDVHNYLHYLAVSVLIDNWEGFHNNFYLYRTDYGKFEIIPWDLDNTFNNSSYTIYGSNHLSEKLLNVPQYREYYTDYLLHLISNEFSEENMNSMIDELHDHLKNAYSNDPSLKAYGSTLEMERHGLIGFIGTRRAYIASCLSNQ
jgi:spore coat protein H